MMIINIIYSIIMQFKLNYMIIDGVRVEVGVGFCVRVRVGIGS